MLLQQLLELVAGEAAHISPNTLGCSNRYVLGITTAATEKASCWFTHAKEVSEAKHAC